MRSLGLGDGVPRQLRGSQKVQRAAFSSKGIIMQDQDLTFEKFRTCSVKQPSFSKTIQTERGRKARILCPNGSSLRLFFGGNTFVGFDSCEDHHKIRLLE